MKKTLIAISLCITITLAGCAGPFQGNDLINPATSEDTVSAGISGAADSEAGDSDAANSDAADLDAAKSEAGDSGAAGSDAGDSDTADSDASDPATADPAEDSSAEDTESDSLTEANSATDGATETSLVSGDSTTDTSKHERNSATGSDRPASDKSSTEGKIIYTERTIGDVIYTVPKKWIMEHYDDDGLLEQNYIEFATGHANNFMSVWYMPPRSDGASAEQVIDAVLTSAKEYQYCDSFESGRITLENGLEATEYQYHMTDDDLEEHGYFIPIGKKSLLMIFYFPRKIHDADYIPEIRKIVDSVKISETATEDSQSNSHGKEDTSGSSDKTDQSASATVNSDQSASANANSDGSASASVNSNQPAASSSSGPGDGGHNYYKNVSSDGIAAADAIAQQIASSIMSNTAYTTDLQRVSAAAATVKGYCDRAQYGQDSSKFYRSPYGVFVAGVYTCAGSARALGRVLDYMGYSWQHANENQNRHQWCILTMDGQTGFADGMSGIAGYGTMTNGMTLPDGSQIFFVE